MKNDKWRQKQQYYTLLNVSETPESWIVQKLFTKVTQHF